MSVDGFGNADFYRQNIMQAIYTGWLMGVPFLFKRRFSRMPLDGASGLPCRMDMPLFTKLDIYRFRTCATLQNMWHKRASDHAHPVDS